MTDPTKLSDWLKIREANPKVFERICEAAGVMMEDGCLSNRGDFRLWSTTRHPLPAFAQAALAFGTLYAIGLKHYPEIVESGSEWKVHEKGYLAKDNHTVPWEATFPAAALAAAHRVWCE